MSISIYKHKWELYVPRACLLLQVGSVQEPQPDREGGGGLQESHGQEEHLLQVTTNPPPRPTPSVPSKASSATSASSPLSRIQRFQARFARAASLDVSLQPSSLPSSLPHL